MELLDVLDEQGNYTGESVDRKTVHEKGLWHIHAGAWIMNYQGEILFQQRSLMKEANPNKWTRTGGHVDSGEKPLEAMQREIEEEIGVKIPMEKFELISIDKRVYEHPEKKKYDKNFIYSYFVLVDYKIEDYVLQESEVSNVKYITIDEMKKAKEENDESYTFIHWCNFDKVIAMLEEKKTKIDRVI